MRNFTNFYKNYEGEIKEEYLTCFYQYEKIFYSFQEHSVRLLRIGEKNQSSLDILSQFFSEDSHLVVCQIEPFNQHPNDDSPFNVVVGDVLQEEIKIEIDKISNNWDIIIQNGSNHHLQLIQSFANFFPKISDGGMYITEYTSKNIDDDASNPYSSMAFFKRLTDVINFIDRDDTFYCRDLLSDYEIHYGCAFDKKWLSQIHSIEFTNSHCIIHKRTEKKELLQNNKTVVKEIKQSQTPYSSEKIINKIQLHHDQKVKELTEQIESRNHQIAIFMASQYTTAAKITKFISRSSQKYIPHGSLQHHLAMKTLKLGKLIYHHGIRGTIRLIGNQWGKSNSINSQEVRAEPNDYANWISAKEPSSKILQQQNDSSPPFKPNNPLFSIILPVYKIPKEILQATINSVLQQTWKNWELCITYADLENNTNWELLEKLAISDPRIKIKKLISNGGISINSNAALDFSIGEFIALLDHDDELTPWALYDMAEAIAQKAETDFLYSDKDCINANGSIRMSPLFKPSWSPEMMFSVNYLTHFNVMRTSIVKNIGGWNAHTDGAQDYDLFLRVIEKSRHVQHVPGIHYHWRIISGSTASEGFGAKPYAALGQLRTLEMRVQRLGLKATVMPHPESNFHIIWQTESKPSIDLVLHGEENNDPMNLIHNIINQLGNQIASITILVNPKNIKSLPSSFPGKIPFSVLIKKQHNTQAISEAISVGNAPAVVLIDQSILKFSPSSLQDISGWVLQHPEIGFSVPIILTKHNIIIEAGRITGNNHQSYPLFKNTSLYSLSAFGKPSWYRNVSSGSPKAIAFKRNLLHLNASLPINEAIVSCCTDMQKNGFRGVVSPHARIKMSSKKLREESNWDESMRHDPYFHKAFSYTTSLKYDLNK